MSLPYKQNQAFVAYLGSKVMPRYGDREREIKKGLIQHMWANRHRKGASLDKD